jgi:hypothetical protein
MQYKLRYNLTNGAVIESDIVYDIKDAQAKMQSSPDRFLFDYNAIFVSSITIIESKDGISWNFIK